MGGCSPGLACRYAPIIMGHRRGVVSEELLVGATEVVPGDLLVLTEERGHSSEAESISGPAVALS